MSSIPLSPLDRPCSVWTRARVSTLGLVAALALAGCDEQGNFAPSLPNFMTNTTKPSDGTGSASAAASGQVIERDVEAPEVFNVSEQGLWDGRPSLGGVWVAHPDVTDPERVIIRNEANGKFVIGALFRRERELPGPKLQMSSDAAASLDVLAGAPAPLNVTALRREETEIPPVETAPEDITTVESVEAPSEIAETTLDPIASAGAAIDAAEPTPVEAEATQVAAPAATPTPTPQPEPRRSNLEKPFIQIGIFSKEANADRAAKQMQSAGLLPTVKQSEINGKAFWRVVVGPATNRSELNTIQSTIKGEGFSDAYAVTN